ncbi:peptidase M23 [Microbacterium sp.]|uniref:peptidase M23 n=1 Tax=Microbacterium sp. TaxID=51671 RepID=UPI00289CECDD|nr:peptidase M23 [Microbacterium sp.]
MARSAPARTRRPPSRTRGTTATRRAASARRAAAARRARARARRRAWRLTAIIALPTIALALVVAGMLGLFAGFGAGGSSRDGDAPASAEYTREQRDNAAIIVSAGRDLGLSARDQTIAVMTAMGESSLRNLDYGDWETSGVTNPDGTRTTSIGLFQQQDGWGTRDERLDPYTAAVLFYRAMVARVPDRDGREPTEVAHRTQINRDRDHYAPYWPRAVALVAALDGDDDGVDY